MKFEDIVKHKELRNALVGALMMVFISFLSFQIGKAIGAHNVPTSACAQSQASPDRPSSINAWEPQK